MHLVTAVLSFPKSPCLMGLGSRMRSTGGVRTDGWMHGCMDTHVTAGDLELGGLQNYFISEALLVRLRGAGSLLMVMKNKYRYKVKKINI